MLTIYISFCNTSWSRPDRLFLKVTLFYPSIHKSKKHFDISFACNALTIWNDLPDYIWLAILLRNFRSKLKVTCFQKLIHLSFSLWCLWLLTFFTRYMNWSSVFICCALEFAVSRNLSAINVQLQIKCYKVKSWFWTFCYINIIVT